jgi:hypothetical protein
LFSNEKDVGEEADTVGCCSLRVEHVTFDADGGDIVTFDFLGKDSMPYRNTVQLDPRVVKNLRSFCARKRPTDNIFDLLSTTELNEHLKTLMPDLSAKVFRTYNASITLQKELREGENRPTIHDSIQAKVLFYNACNRTVASHARTQRDNTQRAQQRSSSSSSSRGRGREGMHHRHFTHPCCACCALPFLCCLVCTYHFPVFVSLFSPVQPPAHAGQGPRGRGVEDEGEPRCAAG